MTVQLAASQSGTQPGNSTTNWLNIWNANPTGPGTYAGFNITHYATDTEVSFDYPDGGGNFGVNRPLTSINSNGPGGSGGPFGPGGDNYGVRAQTILEFTVGGTYTIAMGSDDGRRISLTEALPGSAPGYTGFTSTAGSQLAVNPNTSTAIGFDGGTGHAVTLGAFTVAAGDILALDAFYYEGTGGDSGEISLAQGAPGTFVAGGGVGQFQLLQDNLFGGAVQLATSVVATPEPAGIALWGLGGLAFAALAYRRVRRK
jgi:hypothetical protein